MLTLSSNELSKHVLSVLLHLRESVPASEVILMPWGFLGMGAGRMAEQEQWKAAFCLFVNWVQTELKWECCHAVLSTHASTEVTCQEAEGKKSNSSCCFVFSNKLMAFHFFLSSTVTTISRTSSDLWFVQMPVFTRLFLKLSTAPLEAVLAGATLLQGGHGLQLRWDTCLFLSTAGTADSQDREAWAQVRASELGLGQASWLPGRLGVFLSRLQVLALLELCVCVGCAVRLKRKFLWSF